MSKDELMSLATQTMEYALKKDVSAAEVFFVDNRVLEVMCSGTSISTERDKSEIGFAVRVLYDNKEGFSYTNKVDKESLHECADEATKMAHVNPANPDIRFSSPTNYPSINNLYSKQISNLKVDEMISIAEEILVPYKSAKVSVMTELSNISITDRIIGIVNSLGVEGMYHKNYLLGGFIAIARDGEKVGGFVTDGFFTRHPKDMNFTEFGENIVNTALRNLNAEKATKIDSDTVIFKPESVFNPLGIVMMLAVGADNVQRNRSMWKDQLADTVAVETFNFVDNPLVESGGGNARPFDDEGHKTQFTSLIKDGVLENFLFDELRANRAKTQSTGNSYRGQGGAAFLFPPNNIFPNAPAIQPGNESFDDLIDDVKLGITFEYFSGSFRQENGVFSGVAKGAQLIKDGELDKPLTNVSIAGNVFDVLKNIQGIGNDTKLINGMLNTPSLKAKGVNISTQS